MDQNASDGRPGNRLGSGSPPPPWGFFATLAFAAAAVVLGQFAGSFALAAFGGSAAEAIRDGRLVTVAMLISAPLQVGALIIASERAGWRAADYLGLTAPRPFYIWLTLACLAIVLPAFDLLSLAVGRDIVDRFQIDIYTSAKAAGGVWLVLLLLAIVVAAPVTEEITFRGFIYRGWAPTILGVPGAVVLPSLIWTLLHVQYDWYGAAQVFLLGLLFGWLRWQGGSTTLPLLAHMVTNLFAMLETIIYVEWWRDSGGG